MELSGSSKALVCRTLLEHSGCLWARVSLRGFITQNMINDFLGEFGAVVLVPAVREGPTATIRNQQVSIMYMTLSLHFVVLELGNVKVKQELAS